jgi:hypothetical protein
LTEPFETHGDTKVQLSVKFGPNGTLYAIVTAPTVDGLLHEAGKLMDAAGFLNEVGNELQARMIVQEAFPDAQTVYMDPSNGYVTPPQGNMAQNSPQGYSQPPPTCED